MKESKVTIVVVPRERFAFTARSLESLLAHTEPPFSLVYVDGGSPRRVRRYLERTAQRVPFHLVRQDRYLAPSEARNLGLREAETEYVVFVDNDVLFTPGWLTALVRCAERTGAWICGPLILIGEPEAQAIHAAGSEVAITGAVGKRVLSEEHNLMGKRVPDVRPLLRADRCDAVESHCLLVRADVFERLGPWDERLRALHEHLDLCFAVREAGGSVYFEPQSVVSYVPPPPLASSDVPFFLLRWSEEWAQASLRRFQEKWDLDPDDPGFDATIRFCRHHRRIFLRRTRGLYHRLLGGHGARVTQALVLPAERRLTRLAIRSMRAFRRDSAS